MAINLKSTGGLTANGVKLLVYGQAGAGKTTLIKTLPDPIILSAEGGLLSIRDANLPYIEISDLDTLREAYAWLTGSDEAKRYQSVALDSISEIAEVVLNAEKKATKDPRQAYGAMQEQMADIIRAFRDLPGKRLYNVTHRSVSKLILRRRRPGTEARRWPVYGEEIPTIEIDNCLVPHWPDITNTQEL